MFYYAYVAWSVVSCTSVYHRFWQVKRYADTYTFLFVCNMLHSTVVLSLFQATISNNNYEIEKCFLPVETTVIWTYIFGGVTIILVFIINKCISSMIRKEKPADRYMKMN